MTATTAIPLSGARTVPSMIGVLAVTGAVVCTTAQTKIVPPKNGYKPSEDVELGKKAAVQAEKEMPVLHDELVTGYTRGVGARLVSTIPREFRHPEFQYTFKVLDVKDINAFALPGGPMYVHRGIIEAAGTEGELAGVMAHEMSHVALRHGTAQLSKQKKQSLFTILGTAAGILVGGNAGQAIYEGSQLGVGAYFLRYSREDEKQADLLGVQMMARAGYDPRDLAHMFETIEKEGGSRPPQWLSDHPNPGNRVEYIEQEANSLTIENPIGATPDFDKVRAHLKALPPARTLAEIAKENKR